MGTEVNDVAPQSVEPVAEHPGKSEPMLLSLHPAMFRNHPFQYLVVVAVFAFGLSGSLISLTGWDMFGLSWVGQTPLWISLSVAVLAVAYWLGWWVQTRFVTLNVTSERSVYRQGLLARSTSEVRHEDVRNLQVDQTIVERLLGVGRISISSSGQDDFEIRVRGIPRPNDVAETIRNHQ